MAILLYPNGLTEEFKSKEFTFTDEELIIIFGDFDKTRTFRLYEVPNTWCVWGENEPIDKVPDEFNKIGSDILDQPCYSPILFLHDTEIDPAWDLTDRMIMFGYDDFKLQMLQFFDDVAADIMEERRIAREQEGVNPQTPIVMEQVGISEDKRIIFKFDIDNQPQEFFAEENLLEFAKKAHNFLKFKYRDGDIFAVYADKNIIMVSEDNKVKPLIEKLIAFFKSQENYEACSVLRNTFERWEKYKLDSQNKAPAKKDSKEDDSKETK